MRDANPCYTAGHLADCDWAECEGCRPAEAAHGFVCEPCYRRIAEADTRWDEFLTMLGGEDRAQSPDLNGGHGHAGPRIPIPALQVDIDEVNNLRGAATVDMLVSTELGAADAVRFAHKVTIYTMKHPTQEWAKNLPLSRCEKCRQRSLVYQPPAAPGSKAVIRCLRCSHSMDEDTFERYAAIEVQCCRRCRSELGCTGRTCTCHTFAPVPQWQQTAKGITEVFDPRKPEHAALRTGTE
jgi:hypothetical protein